MAEDLLYPLALKRHRLKHTRKRAETALRSPSGKSQELIGLLEQAVLPRLYKPASSDALRDVHQEHVATLARLALQQNAPGAIDQLLQMHQQGITRQALYVDYLGEAARLLGELWEEDRADFTSVTLGVAFLQQLLRELRSRLDTDGHFVGHHHRVLLVPAANEQHTFGLSILAEFFRDAGWDVCGGPQMSQQEQVRLVAREQFDVVGISAGTPRVLPALSRQIARFRKARSRRSPKLMLGGPLLGLAPAKVGLLDIDATAEDAVAAVRIAHTLVAS